MLTKFTLPTRPYGIILLLICVTLSTSSFDEARAQDGSRTIVLDHEPRGYSIGRSLEILSDKEGVYEPSDIFQKKYSLEFSPSDSDVPRVVGRHRVGWAKFALENPTNEMLTVLLEFRYMKTYVELIQKTKSGFRSTKYGSFVNNPSQYSFGRYPVFKIDLEPGISQFLLRVQDNKNIRFPLHLWSDSHLRKHAVADFTYISIFYGIIIAMLAYNFLISFSLGTFTHAMYFIFTLSQCCFFLIVDGILVRFAPVEYIPYLTTRGFNIAVVTINVSFLLFFINHLDYKKNRPRSKKFLTGLVFTNLILYGLVVFISLRISTPVTWIVGWFNFASIIVFSVIDCCQKKRPAYFLAAANFPYIATCILLPLSGSGLVPVDNALVYFKIAFVNQILLYSIALGDKIRQKEIMAKNEISHLYKELKEKERARTLFFHNTSHELRTPLNGIIGFLSIALSGKYGALENHLKVQLNKVLGLAQGLKNQVNTILDLASSKRGELILANSQIPLHDIVRETIQLADGLVGNSTEKSFSCHHSWDLKEAPVFINDYEKLLTIIRNLVGNGFKFKDPSRSNHVSIDFQYSLDHLKVTVSDTGIGIPAEQKEFIFQEFRQIEEDSHRQFEGNGLGLALVKSIVELMKGTIEIESEIGVGSKFIISIPQQKKIDAALPLRIENAPDLENSWEDNEDTEIDTLPVDPKNHRILVVDDNQINCEVIQEILQISGYPVDIALDGKEALAKIRKNKPDILVLDLMMPGVSGEDVIASIRSEVDLKDLPIVVVTARASHDDRIAALEMGADEYLAKPIISDELLLRIRNATARLDFLSEKSQKASLQEEFRIARTIQESLVPDSKFAIDQIDYSQHFLPAEEAGGDWFNLFHDAKRQRLFILLGDVTGHGVPSAIVTGVAFGASTALLKYLSTPELQLSINEILIALNKHMDESITETESKTNRTMTMVFVGIDLESGQSSLINAGHNGAILFSDEKPKTLMKGGYPLGFGKAGDNSILPFTLNLGESLFFYTDGLVENEGPDGSTLRLPQLRRQLNSQDTPANLKRSILGKCEAIWQKNAPEDDCTFLIVKRVKNKPSDEINSTEAS